MSRTPLPQAPPCSQGHQGCCSHDCQSRLCRYEHQYEICSLAVSPAALRRDFAAQFGRLCTFAAIEDAVVAGDLRRARAWALAIATAIACTQAMLSAGLINLSGNPYAYARIEFGGLIAGATLFGVGMSLVGTCGFGVLVRTGTGDLRALIAGLVLGIAAFAATGGVLSEPRLWISKLLTIDTSLIGGAHSRNCAKLFRSFLVRATSSSVSFDARRIRPLRRPFSQAAALACGWAPAWLGGGRWLVRDGQPCRSIFVRPTKSLSFVAPLGRVVLIAMGETISHSAFGVASVVGVVAGSFVVCWTRGLLGKRLMTNARLRRHLLGAVLMGFGRRVGARLYDRPGDVSGKRAGGDSADRPPMHDCWRAAQAILPHPWPFLLGGLFDRLRGPERAAPRGCRPSRAPRG